MVPAGTGLMELRHLPYALAVAEAGSFTRAAARLRLAQQARSQQIADLERELQVRLFDRTARGASPTDAGWTFLQAARDTLLQSERAITLARNGAVPSFRHWLSGDLHPGSPQFV
jgi:DNA-binding transcriptional LysR family regulator